MDKVFLIILLFSPLLFGADLQIVLLPLQIFIFIVFLVHFKNPAKQISFHALPGSLRAGWAGLALILTISTFFSVNPHVSLKFLTYFFAVSACFTLAALGRISKRQVFFLCGVMIFSANLQIIIGVLQKLGFLSHKHWNPAAFMAGTFFNHNHFSSLLEITLPLVLSFLCCKVDNKNFYIKIGLFISLGLHIGGLILAQSRAGWLSGIAGIIYFFIAIAEKINRKRIFGGVLAVILISFTFIFLNQEAVGKRFETLLTLKEDHSAQARIKFWETGFQIIREHPLIGTGPGTVPLVFPKYRPENIQYYVNQLHNDYLGWMAEAGVLTFPCLFMILFVFVSRPWWKREILPAANLFIVAAGSAVLALSLHSLVDYNLRIPAIAFYLAVLTGFSFRKEETP